jgi:hypothetical protein
VGCELPAGEESIPPDVEGVPIPPLDPPDIPGIVDNLDPAVSPDAPEDVAPKAPVALVGGLVEVGGALPPAVGGVPSTCMRVMRVSVRMRATSTICTDPSAVESGTEILVLTPLTSSVVVQVGEPGRTRFPTGLG